MPREYEIVYACKSIRLIVFFMALLSFSSANCQVLISELMHSPQNGEPEWIELYNNSDSDVNLDSAFICDAGACKRIFGLTIKAYSYIVLTNNPDFLVQKYSINDLSVLHKMALPSLNNTSDEIILKNKDSELLDSVYYDAKWGKSGVSLERKYFDRIAVGQDNLFPSLASLGATPAAKNSVVAAKCEFQIIASLIKDKLYYKIENKCDLPKDFLTQLSIDFDKSNIIDKNEIIFESTKKIMPNATFIDSCDLSSLIKVKLKGRYKILFEASDIENDEKKEFSGYYQTPLEKNDVVINEIMPVPQASSAEYIELFNATSDTISLDGWRIYDESGTFDKKYMDLSNCQFPPNSYFVFVSDSSFFNQFPNVLNSPAARVVKSSVTLNNTSDLLVLADSYRNVIDSLYYDVKWHNSTISNSSGISLERVLPNMESNDKDNWASSGDMTGGTPTFENTAKAVVSAGRLEANPNPFHLATHSECEISYKLPFRQARLRLQIFAESGQLVAEPANNIYTNAEGLIKWNGKNDSGRGLPDGIYIVFIEAVATDTEQVYSEKAVLVLKN